MPPLTLLHFLTDISNLLKPGVPEICYRFRRILKMTDTLFLRRPDSEVPDPVGPLIDGDDVLFMAALPLSRMVIEDPYYSGGIDYPPSEEPDPPVDSDSPEDPDSSTTPPGNNIDPPADNPAPAGPEPPIFDPVAPDEPQPDEPPSDTPQPDDSSGSGYDPPSSPVVETNPDDAESDEGITPAAEIIPGYPPNLTNASPSTHLDSDVEEAGWFQNLLNRGRDFVESLSGRLEDEASGYGMVVPSILPPPRNPALPDNPEEDFASGYISQRDLERSLDREAWTMCCAATFVYATQTRYPGMEREAIVDAVDVAADTPLADGSDSCVGADGTVASAYQFSQALARELGLKEYVDVSGFYPDVEAAQKDGATMMKVELSGTINGTPQEHHLLQIGESLIDPIPGEGVSGSFDPGSAETENVMSLDWYRLPEKEGHESDS